MAQIALDLEVDVVTEVEAVLTQVAPEFGAHRMLGKIGDVTDHARQLEAALGHGIDTRVPAVMEFRVRANRLTRDFIEGDVLRREFRRAGDDGDMTDAIRVVHHPLQRLHAAQRAADHCREAGNAERLGEALLALDPVRHGHQWEVRPPLLARLRVDRGRAGTAVAAADVVQRDDEEARGINGLAGADVVVPPARLAVAHGVIASRMMVAGEGMTDQDGVAGVRVQLAVGLVDQRVLLEASAAGQLQRGIEVGSLRRDETDRIRGQGIRHRGEGFQHHVQQSVRGKARVRGAKPR